MKQNKNQVNVTAAYSTALKNARSGGGKLTQEKAGIIAVATIKTLHTNEGISAQLSQTQFDILKSQFHPTREIKIKVLASTLAEAGITLDDTTQELLEPLFTPANFEKMLAKTKAPTVDWRVVAGAAEADEVPHAGDAAASGETLEADEIEESPSAPITSAKKSK